jgi:hypothetical protein
LDRGRGLDGGGIHIGLSVRFFSRVAFGFVDHGA